MIRINLLPKEILKKETGKRIAYMVVFLIFIVVGIFLGVFMMKFAQLKSLNAKIRKIEKQLAPLQPIIIEVDQLESKKNAFMTKLNAIKNLIDKSIIYPKFMETLASIVPTKVWLTKLRVTTKPDYLYVDMDSSAYDNNAVAEFYKRLEQSPNFNGLKISKISVVESGKARISKFKLTCNYRVKVPEEKK